MSVKPNRPAPLLPPGTYVEEWLEDQEINQQELASRLEVSPKHLSQVINGHVPISPEMAAKLEAVTGYPVEFWLEHQARYTARLTELKITADDIACVKALLPGGCITRLREAGIVTSSWRNAEKLVREIFAQAQVAGTEALRGLLQGNGAVAYRQSTAYEIRSGEQWAWLEIVKAKAKEAPDVAVLDKHRLQSLIPSLRAASQNDPSTYVQTVGELLQSAGVIFIAEPDISGARISGASFDIEGTPVIAVTDKQKREDIFWFTLFHEIAHVLNDDYLLGSMDLDSEVANRPLIEVEADKWATNALLSEEHFESFQGPYSVQRVRAFAEAHEISPAIVAGRLKHHKKVDQAWGRVLFRRFAL